MTDVYTAEQRKAYADSLPRSAKPKKSAKLAQPTSLADLEAGKVSTTPPKRRTRKKKTGRTALIPKNCDLEIENPRVNALYNELLSLNVDQYPNAAAVTLRVFVELSVDVYLADRSLMSENDRRNATLAKRMKLAAEDLKKQGKIEGQVEMAVKRAADSPHLLNASTITMNQYVHNPHIIPKPSEIRLGWDELQPLVVAIWPTA